MTDLSEGEMLQDRVCMLCEGTGTARHDPNPRERCHPCDGPGKMTEGGDQP